MYTKAPILNTGFVSSLILAHDEHLNIYNDLNNIKGMYLKNVTSSFCVDEEPREPSEPVVTFEDQRPKSPAEDRAPSPSSPPRAKPEPKQATPEPKASPKAEAKPKTDKEREMEEYKAKLAEKRRLAREKAEREAEIERLREEELQ